MARITVEDCFGKINNRFELVVLAVQLAKDMESGFVVCGQNNKNKNPVLALRQIAAGDINIGELKTRIIKKMQMVQLIETFSDENDNSCNVDKDSILDFDEKNLGDSDFHMKYEDDVFIEDNMLFENISNEEEDDDDNKISVN